MDNPLIMLEPSTPVFEGFVPSADSPLYRSAMAHPEAVDIFPTTMTNVLGGIMKTVDKQLIDFIPGGKYAEKPPQQDLDRTRCAGKKTLNCERQSGSLDSSQTRRPNAICGNAEEGAAQQMPETSCKRQGFGSVRGVEGKFFVPSIAVKKDRKRTKHVCNLVHF
ncbi:hypothetical protein BaRGS_00006183 [Batillaria attramentaria]|uniref:Uncharacterized protein n=1 Tax=Batillaria attramentaria TaxID=370345 RepID=A0ABD0LU05_9CAEN